MAENFSDLKRLVKKLVRTEFQKEWLFRLEIEGAPSDFDLYVKDVTYGPTEVATEDEQYGTIVYTWPTGYMPVKVVATVRDNEDCRVSKFVDECCTKATHTDGTVGLPYGADGYVRKVRVFVLSDDGSETLEGEWEMYFTQRGDITRSRDNSGFVEFPVSLVQFSTGDESSSI